MIPSELTHDSCLDLRTRIRRFLDDEIASKALAWEQARHVPLELLKKVADEKFMGLSVSESRGGQGKGFWDEVTLAEELSKAHATGWVLSILVQSQVSAYLLEKLGSEEAIETILKPALLGDFYLALAATEPNHGSDIAQTETEIIKKKGQLRINGHKRYITNGSIAKYAIVLARDAESSGPWGLSLVLCPLEGKTVDRRRLVTNGLKTGDTAEIYFNDTPIEPWMYLGAPERGFVYLMQGLMRERLFASVALNQLVADVLETTKKHLLNTQRFDCSLWEHQVLRHKWIDHYIEHEASTQFAYSVCRQFAKGEPSDKQVAMLKVHTCETAKKIIASCAQMIGASAFVQDHWMAHAVADSQAFTLAAGSSEIMKELVGGWVRK